MSTIIESLSPKVALSYQNGELKTILIRKGCDKIEWEAIRHSIPFEMDELTPINHDKQVPDHI
jgi:hypothetical protein